MKLLSEVLKLSSSFLEEKGVDRPRRSAEELLAHILKMKRIDLYLHFDLPLKEEELISMRSALARRTKNEPVEYINGKVDFFGAEIGIDRRVLIPRQETEILAEHVSKRIKGEVLWDLCTGSGCLGISLKKRFPHLEVTLSDLSEEALSVASENGKRNGVVVTCLKGDLFAPFQGKKADVIVCNPPYLSSKEYEGLDVSVSQFEPKKALIGGESGLEFYERLAKGLPDYLNPGGQAFLEIGAAQGKAVLELFSKGPWGKIELEKDWSGKDRFVFLKLKVFEDNVFLGNFELRKLP